MFRITLKAARVNAGITQSEMARILGINPGTLRSYEDYKTVPRWDVVDKMVEVYGLPLSFIEFDGEPRQQKTKRSEKQFD